MNEIIYFIIFIFGLLVGSFLNVVIFRLESGEEIVNDRSKCGHCGHILSWSDLFPVFSFLALKGKCRYCKKKISLQYPIVEIVTGVLFVAVFNHYNFSEFLFFGNFFESVFIFYLLFITSSLIVIFFYDLKYYIIPDAVIYPAIIISLGFILLQNFSEGFSFNFFISGLDVLAYNFRNAVFLNNFFAAIVSGGFFLSIIFATKGKGMGGGDVKLGFLMGLLLGWPVVLLALFLSFILGSVVGILLILFAGKKMKSMVPFGPFLITGTFIAMFWGERIINRYLALFV